MINYHVLKRTILFPIVCLITIITNFTYLIASPINVSRMNDSNISVNFINASSFDDDDILNNKESLSTMTLLTTILDQTSIALSQGNETIDQFAHRVFGMNSKELDTNWKEVDYDWLPQYKNLHKKLHERVNKDHLLTISLDDTLIHVYHYLKTIFFGLKQMIIDQAIDGWFLESFSKSVANLHLLKEEIHTAVIERNINNQLISSFKKVNISNFVNMNDSRTAQNIRDWIIYRDYVTLLEYIWEVFDYLKKKECLKLSKSCV